MHFHSHKSKSYIHLLIKSAETLVEKPDIYALCFVVKRSSSGQGVSG